MEKTEDIVNALYEVVSKDTKISKPFIVNAEGEGKIACFTYLQTLKGGKKYITDVLGVYLVDFNTLDVREFEIEEPIVELPIEIKALSNVEDNLKQRQREYFECIDEFFMQDEIDAEKYAQLFSMIEYDELRTIYSFFGAEFI